MYICICISVYTGESGTEARELWKASAEWVYSHAGEMRVSKEGFVTRTLRREALQVLILSALRVCVCACVRACVCGASV